MGATWAAPKGGARASAEVTFLGNMTWGRGLGGVSRTPSEDSGSFSGFLVRSWGAAGLILACMARSRREGLGPVLGCSVNGLPERSMCWGEGDGEVSTTVVSGAVRRESRETARTRRLVVGVIFTWLRDLFSVVESMQLQHCFRFLQFNPLKWHVKYSSSMYNLLDTDDVSLDSFSIVEWWYVKPVLFFLSETEYLYGVIIAKVSNNRNEKD